MGGGEETKLCNGVFEGVNGYVINQKREQVVHFSDISECISCFQWYSHPTKSTSIYYPLSTTPFIFYTFFK